MKKTLFLLLIISFLLSGCTGDRCIDADDFGFAKFVISSRYSREDLYEQQQGNQIAPWRDSNLRVNGRPLTILVKPWEYGIDRNKAGEVSAWCPWYGTADNKAKLSRFCERLPSCIFVDNKMCTATKDARIGNAPCLLKNGIGLYALIAERGTDPNESFISQRSPEGLTIHLGEPITGFKLYDIDRKGRPREAGGIVYQYEEPGEDSQGLKRQYAASKLYFKILDKFYDDNNGQYRIVIKSGVSDDRPDPIEFLTKLVKENLFGSSGDDYGLIKNIYINVTENPSYRFTVKALLTLYIVFTALSFLIGNIEITQTEFVIRMLKFSIISVLLSSEYSWSFFHDYLFVFFVEGLEQILQIIQNAAQTGSGSSSILGLMIAPQTMAKLFSLLFVDWRGFIYIILFLIALYFVFMMLFQATIIYLTALIAIGMIIVMGPIFLCFLLFQITRSLFENWLKQLIGYAMQPLILFAGIAFISVIIRSEIYSALGFRVCKYDFPNLGPISELFGEITESTADLIGLDVSLGSSIFYWWFPVPMKGKDFTKVKAVIPVPQDYFKDDGTFCEAYGCFEERYVELPFLDPIKDQRRINNFFNGNYAQLDGLFLIFLAMYLLSKFNDLSVSVSKFLSSTTGNLTDLRGAAQQAFSPIKEQMDRPITAAKERLDKKREELSTSAAKGYENYMMGRLRKEAMGDNASSSVLKEVKRNYGIDSKDVNMNAIKDYREALKGKLREQNPNMSNKELDKMAKELSKKDYSELDPKFKNLNMKGLAAEAKLTRDFQGAYASAHQDMSGRGIGMFGKQISPLRKYEELNYKIKQNKEEKEMRRMNSIERTYAGLEEKLIGGTMNHQDKRLRTYSETLADEKRSMQQKALNAQINRETVKAKDDILKPEYLAYLEAKGRTTDLRMYQDLSRRKLSHDVQDALSSGDNPALMGDKFMRTKATDSQSRQKIDRANEIKQEFLANDKYLRREDRYEVMNEKAINNIKDKHELLKNHYKRDDIKAAEMPAMLEKYYNENRGINQLEAKKELDGFKKSLQDYDHSKKILEKLEDRKAQITEEFGSHIDKMNLQRKSANLSEYNKPQGYEKKQYGNLDDHLKSTGPKIEAKAKETPNKETPSREAQKDPIKPALKQEQPAKEKPKKEPEKETPKPEPAKGEPKKEQPTKEEPKKEPTNEPPKPELAKDVPKSTDKENE